MKIYILTFGLLLFSFVARSQKISSVSVNYGISHSDLAWEYDAANNPYINLGLLGSKSITGLYCNVDVESFESKYLALVTGVGFYQKGALDEFTSEGKVVGSYKWNLDYFTIDTKLKAKIRFKNLSPYLLVGPRLDYLLRFSSEFNEYDQLAKLSKINYGLRGGIGVQYLIDNFIVGIGWEKNYNFNPIVDNNGENIRPEFTIDDKTMIFKCEIGFRFNK